MDKNRDIFLSILESHKGIVYKIANSYCKEVEDREDLVQEIIVQLWQSFDKYDSKYKYSTWVYRIALNTSISFYRKSKNRNEKTIQLSPILETSISDDESLQENPDVDLLQGFIRELRDIDKALILLYLDGLSQKEISKITGITPTNISTKIGRIKKFLKERFLTIKKQNYGG